MVITLVKSGFLTLQAIKEKLNNHVFSSIPKLNLLLAFIHTVLTLFLGSKVIKIWILNLTTVALSWWLLWAQWISVKHLNYHTFPPDKRGYQHFIMAILFHQQNHGDRLSSELICFLLLMSEIHLGFWTTNNILQEFLIMLSFQWYVWLTLRDHKTRIEYLSYCVMFWFGSTNDLTSFELNNSESTIIFVTFICYCYFHEFKFCEILQLFYYKFF
jgi:hypothetical protein